MPEKLKLLIADDEQLICNLLERLIEFEKLGLELIGTIYDGVSLLKTIEEKKPDIVITDICMPGIDGLEVIRLAKERGLESKFIVISGYRQFEYAYDALKYDVEDYILKPVDEEELNTALRRIIGRLQKNPPPLKQSNRSPRLIPLVISAFNGRNGKSYSMEDFNVAWNLKFQAGLFQVVFLRLDHLDNLARNGGENIESLINKIQELLLRQFTPVCYEVVVEPKNDGVRILLNYGSGQAGEIQSQIKQVFQKVRELLSLFWGISETVCVSNTVSEMEKLEEIVDQARAAEWARMALGVDRIIRFAEIENQQRTVGADYFAALERKTRIASETLDEAGFKQCMDDFFSLPLKDLSSSDACQFIRNVMYSFFQINRDKLLEYTNPDSLYRQLSISLHTCTTYSRYMTVLNTGICRIMQQLNTIQNSKSARPIVFAIAYIEQHYDKKLYLEDVAKEVGLSPVYLSNLFKKETGKNFVDYITEYRLKAASNLLKDSMLNVSEIASSVGFSDGRYFSKQFKKFFGIKPTEYRKLYR